MMAFRVWRLAFGVWRSSKEKSSLRRSAGRHLLKTSLRIDGGQTFQVDDPLRETPNAKRATPNVL
jgi:hypothetical protein